MKTPDPGVYRDIPPDEYQDPSGEELELSAEELARLRRDYD